MVVENSLRVYKGVIRGLFGLKEWIWAKMSKSNDLEDLDQTREANL
jgi:hypothetical protein